MMMRRKFRRPLEGGGSEAPTNRPETRAVPVRTGCKLGKEPGKMQGGASKCGSERKPRGSPFHQGWSKFEEEERHCATPIARANGLSPTPRADRQLTDAHPREEGRLPVADREAALRENHQRKLERLLQEGKTLLPSDPSVVAHARAIARQRRQDVLREGILFLILVILPTAIMAFHLLVSMPPLFRSEARFLVERGTEAGGLTLSGLGLGAGGPSSALKDAFMVRDLLLAFATEGPGERPPSAGDLAPAGLVQGYLGRVKISIDVQSGMLDLSVAASSPEEARRKADMALDRAAGELNRISNRIYHDQISLTEVQRREAEAEVARARQALVALELASEDLDPRQTAAGLYAQIHEIEAQISDLERQRDVELAAGRKRNPALQRINAELDVLRNQLRTKRARFVAGLKGKPALSEALSQFEAASVQLELARKRWEMILASMEELHREILRNRRYLVIVDPPKTPANSDFTARMRLVVFAFFASFFLYLSARLILSALRMRILGRSTLP